MSGDAYTYHAQSGLWVRRPGRRPSAVQGLTATKTSTTITPSWGAPADPGGSAVNSYYARLLLNGVIVQTGTVTSLSKTFTGLTAATGYVAEVAAGNDAGWGPFTSVAVTTDGTPVVGAGQAQMMFHNGWNGPNLSSYPADVAANTTILSWAIGQSAGAGTGNIAAPPWHDQFGHGYATEAAAKADIAAWNAAGRKAIYCIGGSGDGGIAITNPTQVTQARTTIGNHCNAWGFKGMSLDIESGGWNQTSIVSLAAGLKADIPGFHFDVCMGLYGTYITSFTALAVALGANMDSCSVMLYDFPEARDSRLTAVTVDKVKTLVDRGVPASKAYMLYFPEPLEGYANSTPTPSIATNAMVAARNAYPTLKGSGWWEDRCVRDRAVPWDFPRAMTVAMA